MTGTKVLVCTCQHAAQDKRYGKGRRAHNGIGNPTKHGGNDWRCTVCETERKQ